MNVVRAETLGMCFGVRDALALLDRVDRPERVTVHGELVHNDEVLRRIESRGFRQSSEERRHSLPMTDTVLVTAHGISQRERARLTAAGKTLLDSTCPLVTRAHDAARKLEAAGYHVLVIGRPGHVEVRGIVEDLESYTLVPDAESVIAFPHDRLGVMCQTTTPTHTADVILAEIRRKNPDADIRYVDTICLPTKEHQQALEDLLDKVAVVVVVGGKNSNNTRQLVERCRARGVRAHHVENAADLRHEWFVGVDRVGLTAGTSTLEETIEAVERELERMKDEG
jgi:4-hydroxy-3-methylbut-2-en-1-yl diphosphate reductase